jgi:hypothetical protein
MNLTTNAHRNLHSEQGALGGEHFADGDLFDNTVEPGWAPFAASGLAQWGPPATKDFLGTDMKSARRELVSIVSALRASNEFDVNRLAGLLKVPTS